MFRIILSLFFSGVITVASQNVSARNFHRDCGQVYTSKQFIIESYGYPSNYPLNYDCSYLIKGPTCPTVFTLQFLDFSVEDSLGCSKDRLEIDDKDAICGNRNTDIKEYFSEKGTLILRFVSDGENSGRGYRILVTRSQCHKTEDKGKVPEITTQQNIRKWYTTNKDVEYTTTTSIPLYNTNNNKRCCPENYKSKQFTLTSPNFPYSMSTSTECEYEIIKANANICRLRLHVQFFWLGRSTDCSEGFLEIDGKRICGCKSDLKIISPFESQNLKVLRFVSRGFERSSYSGFVVEVLQDECPKKFIPNKNESDVRFQFSKDQINRAAWRNGSHNAVVEKLHLISENTEIIKDDVNHSDGNIQPQVIRHIYFYAPPDFNRFPRDREETEYFDTSINTNFIQNNNYYCRNWNQLQFNSLSLRRIPVCKTNEGSVAERKCVDLNYSRGYFKTPGYPFYYPGNMNICYRFHKLPGYCSIRIHMKDFNLQDSANCESDYLLFANNLRYCGSTLTNTISILDLRNKRYEQMNFVTDSFYCGRGFFGTYEQVTCEESPHPIIPITSTPPYPQSLCSRTAQEEMFTFEVYDYSEPSCSLVIKKFSQYVCSVNIYFEEFDLICAVESLVIDGTMYCGKLTGQMITIDAKNRDPIIVYKRSSNVGVTGLRLRIKGIQITDNCPYPEVPAERFLKPMSTERMEHKNNTMFILKMTNHFKNICGLITNVTESKLPETFCGLIMKQNNNVTMCLPLTANSLYIPVESEKVDLKITNAEKSEDIVFQEVDCNKLSQYEK